VFAKIIDVVVNKRDRYGREIGQVFIDGLMQTQCRHGSIGKLCGGHSWGCLLRRPLAVTDFATCETTRLTQGLTAWLPQGCRAGDTVQIKLTKVQRLHGSRQEKS
jgi:hypothetical protein